MEAARAGAPRAPLTLTPRRPSLAGPAPGLVRLIFGLVRLILTLAAAGVSAGRDPPSAAAARGQALSASRGQQRGEVGAERIGGREGGDATRPATKPASGNATEPRKVRQGAFTAEYANTMPCGQSRQKLYLRF